MSDMAGTAGPQQTDRGASGAKPHGCSGCLARGVLLIVLALVAAYVAAWIYRLLLATIGEYATPGTAGVVALVAAVVLPLLLVAYGSRMAAAAHRALARLGASAPVQTLERRFPRAAAFVTGRFARHKAAALGLTVAVVVAVALVAFLVDLAVQTTAGSSVALVDLRVVNLFSALREAWLDREMVAIAVLGSVPVVAAVTAVIAAFALRAHRREDAVLLALALLAGILFVAVLDALSPPPRAAWASMGSALLLAASDTVLSAACYGTVAYAGLQAQRRGWTRYLMAVAAAMLILVIGLARMYLGLEYPSAVIAGWGAGLLWVVLILIVEEIWPRHAVAQQRVRERRAEAVAIGGALLAWIAVALAAAYAPISPLPVAASTRPVVIAPEDVPSYTEARLPHYTITLFGARQEPITIILVGTRAQIETAFRAAGWTEAQRLSVGSLAHGIVSALEGRPDPVGPVTPSFVGVQPDALAFSLEVGGSFARRHHTRIWSTTVVTTTGQTVWLAEASFDAGFELSPRTLLPTHHIGPDIDAERAYDVRSLASTGDVARTQLIQLVPPEHGHNAAGDPFFTSGQAAVVWLA